MKSSGRFVTFLLAMLLATFLGCAPTATREGTGEYIDDTVITTKVKAAIVNEPTLKAAEINVETFKGVVQLSGFVSSQANVNDAVITAKVKAAVLEDSSLKSAEINVETYKGIVQLSGFVRSRADIDRAVLVAKGVSGVTSVKNDMRVK